MYWHSCIKYFFYTASTEALLVVAPIILLQKYTQPNKGLGNNPEENNENKDSLSSEVPSIQYVGDNTPSTLPRPEITPDVSLLDEIDATLEEGLPNQDSVYIDEETQEEETKEEDEIQILETSNEEEEIPEEIDTNPVDESAESVQVETIQASEDAIELPDDAETSKGPAMALSIPEMDSPTSTPIAAGTTEVLKDEVVADVASSQIDADDTDTDPQNTAATTSTTDIQSSASNIETKDVISTDPIIPQTSENNTNQNIANSSETESSLETASSSGSDGQTQQETTNTQKESSNTQQTSSTTSQDTSVKKPKKPKSKKKAKTKKPADLLIDLENILNLNDADDEDDLTVEDEEEMFEDTEEVELAEDEEEMEVEEEVEETETKKPVWQPVTIPKNFRHNWPALGGPNAVKHYIYGYTANSSHAFTDVKIKQKPEKNYGCVYLNYYDSYCVAEKIQWTKDPNKPQVLTAKELDGLASEKDINQKDFSQIYHLYRFEVLAGLYDRINWEVENSLYLFGSNKEIFGRFVIAFGKKGNTYNYKTKYFKGISKNKAAINIDKEDKCSIGQRAHVKCDYYKLNKETDNQKYQLALTNPETQLTQNQEYFISYTPVRFDQIDLEKMLVRKTNKQNKKLVDIAPLFAIKDQKDVGIRIKQKYQHDLPIVLLKD